MAETRMETRAQRADYETNPPEESMEVGDDEARAANLVDGVDLGDGYQMPLKLGISLQTPKGIGGHRSDNLASDTQDLDWANLSSARKDPAFEEEATPAIQPELLANSRIISMDSPETVKSKPPEPPAAAVTGELVQSLVEVEEQLIVASSDDKKARHTTLSKSGKVTPRSIRQASEEPQAQLKYPEHSTQRLQSPPRLPIQFPRRKAPAKYEQDLSASSENEADSDSDYEPEVSSATGAQKPSRNRKPSSKNRRADDTNPDAGPKVNHILRRKRANGQYGPKPKTVAAEKKPAAKTKINRPMQTRESKSAPKRKQGAIDLTNTNSSPQQLQKRQKSAAPVKDKRIDEEIFTYGNQQLQFVDQCKQWIEQKPEVFNVSQSCLEGWMTKLYEQTESLFHAAFGKKEHREFIKTNRKTWCRELTKSFPRTISLIIEGKASPDSGDLLAKLIRCLSDEIGEMPAVAWCFAHACFFAFLTSDVFQAENLLAEVGLPSAQSTKETRNFHCHLEESDPLTAKARRIEWRQYLRYRLNAPESEEKRLLLATKLAGQFSTGIQFILPNNRSDTGSNKGLKEDLIPHVQSAILMRVRLSLSSFKYSFTWPKSEEIFDYQTMKTAYRAQGLGPAQNPIRFARSPLIRVSRAKGSNEFAREVGEFKDEEFGAFEVARTSEVVCVHGRMQAP